jgi:Tfp pilus assembly protein PilE
MRKNQQGMTFIGFLILASLIGLLAYGVLRLVPVYSDYMTLKSVMNSVKTELDGQGPNPRTILNAIERRLTVENVSVRARDFTITQTANGYTVSLDHEGRAPYVANIHLVVVFDEQVEIRR